MRRYFLEHVRLGTDNVARLFRRRCTAEANLVVTPPIAQIAAVQLNSCVLVG